MTQRYVWFDDVDRVERVRTELRLPKPLHGFLVDVAKRHDVSLNALLTGIVSYAADADAHRRLIIRVVPGVRVTEVSPADKPLDVPLPPASPYAARPSAKPKVR